MPSCEANQSDFSRLSVGDRTNSKRPQALYQSCYIISVPETWVPHVARTLVKMQRPDLRYSNNRYTLRRSKCTADPQSVQEVLDVKRQREHAGGGRQCGGDSGAVTAAATAASAPLLLRGAAGPFRGLLGAFSFLLGLLFLPSQDADVRNRAGTT